MKIKHGCLGQVCFLLAKISNLFWGRRDCDCIVVGFTTTYAISACHH